MAPLLPPPPQGMAHPRDRDALDPTPEFPFLLIRCLQKGLRRNPRSGPVQPAKVLPGCLVASSAWPVRIARGGAG